MGLPLILDIALGLIFVFLILSLLASEVQELLTTVLQWRAEHLKLSIENLMLGGRTSSAAHQTFVDEFYKSPLIKALNQEAKGILPQFFRGIIQSLGVTYRALTGTKETFGGEKTGPSYIPSRAFADALMQQLGVDVAAQKSSELLLKQFCRERLEMIEGILESLRNSLGDDSVLAAEFEGLHRQLREITDNFTGNRVRLSQALDEAIAQLAQFLDNTEIFLNQNNFSQEIIRARLPFLRQTVLQRRVEPTIYDILGLVIEDRTDIPPELLEVVLEMREGVKYIPPNLRRNILALAEQVQLRVDNLTDGVNQLGLEIENWFNSSMDRASGVYRRNAKGVAITLGILTAISTNSDAFLMVERFAQDTALRNAIIQSADQLVRPQAPGSTLDPTLPPDTEVPNPFPPLGTPAPDAGALPTGTVAQATPSAPTAPPIRSDSELDRVRTTMSEALGDLPLPIGWGEANRSQQLPPDANRWLMVPRIIAGWIVTGLAIAMGSNFWFDVLSKVVRTRNTGNPTKPTPSD
ncbi:hypothetical protein [Vacuolonema iberomarrocanum]|uniref:hypothetical protein n=1 Tax=Vacuolonema iberomarrocanum TaxID=3454632 RepID=UPI0019E88673|nr:hypothetical protein [filamentous cyanobacterium LEGE 07170]